MSAGLPTVALKPTRCRSCSDRTLRRSSTLMRWAPRSVPARAWTSSMTTTCSSAKRAAASTRCETSITSSDSGVVISSSVGSFKKRLRALALMSPCHTMRRRPTISV